MQIVIEPNVTEKLQQLVITLIDEEYFATETAAVKYVQEIYKFIYALPSHIHRTMKEKNMGAFCGMYKANLHTTWYIIFDIKGDNYLVRNLLNNHEQHYPDFLKNLK